MTYQKQIERALAIANTTHAREWRNGPSGLPYMAHIYDIMGLASGCGITPDQHPEIYVAIVLHDVVESGGSYDTIAYECGEPAYEVVRELTYIPGGEYATKQAYLNSFASKSADAVLVKCLDRICNVRDFRNGGKKEKAARYCMEAESLSKLFKIVYQKCTTRLATQYTTF